MAMAAGVLVVAAGVAVGLVLLLGERDAGTEVAEWADYEVTGDGIVVRVPRGSCQRVEDVEVVEERARVEVTTRLEADSWSLTMCNDAQVLDEVPVALESRLGRRPVFDGGCLAEGGSDRDCRRKEWDGTGRR